MGPVASAKTCFILNKYQLKRQLHIFCEVKVDIKRIQEIYGYELLKILFAMAFLTNEATQGRKTNETKSFFWNAVMPKTKSCHLLHWL